MERAKCGSGCRGPQTDGTVVFSARSDRKYSHLPSTLQLGDTLLNRSEVSAWISPVSAFKILICRKLLVADREVERYFGLQG